MKLFWRLQVVLLQLFSKPILDVLMKYYFEADSLISENSFVSKSESKAQKADKLQAAACIALGHVGVKNETVASKFIEFVSNIRNSNESS